MEISFSQFGLPLQNFFFLFMVHIMQAFQSSHVFEHNYLLFPAITSFHLICPSRESAMIGPTLIHNTSLSFYQGLQFDPTQSNLACDKNSRGVILALLGSPQQLIISVSSQGSINRYEIDSPTYTCLHLPLFISCFVSFFV